VRPEQLAGTIQNDILKEFMVRNTYIYPPEPSMRIISDIFAFTSRRCRASTRSRSPAITCRRPGRRRTRARLHPRRRRRVHPRRQGGGLDVDKFAPRLSFFWAIGMNFFMEVAKMRAARLLWARSWCRSNFAPKSEVALAAHPQPDLRLVADRAGRLQQRRAHLHRGDGERPRGTRSRCTPTPSTRRSLCRRILSPHRAQHPARPPAGVGATRHHRPVGGFGYVERLTHDLAKRAWEHIEEVEAAGGMAKAIEAGIPKMRIEEAAARTQARIDSGQQPVIGVNTYPSSRTRRSRSSRSTTPPCAPSSSPSSSGCAASATRTYAGRRPRETDRGSARVGRDARRPTSSRSRSTPPGPRPPSARCRRDGGGLRPLHRADPYHRWRVFRGGRGRRGRQGPPRRWSRSSRRPRAAARASSSPRWARTATTAARRSSRPPSPTSASTSTWARSSRRPRGGAPGRRGRRPHRRGVLARGRSPDPGAGAAGGAGRPRARGPHDRRRRGHPEPGLRATA
jgi:hypothetical protein